MLYDRTHNRVDEAKTLTIGAGNKLRAIVVGRRWLRRFCWRRLHLVDVRYLLIASRAAAAVSVRRLALVRFARVCTVFHHERRTRRPARKLSSASDLLTYFRRIHSRRHKTTTASLHYTTMRRRHRLESLDWSQPRSHRHHLEASALPGHPHAVGDVLDQQSARRFSRRRARRPHMHCSGRVGRSVPVSHSQCRACYASLRSVKPSLLPTKPTTICKVQTPSWREKLAGSDAAAARRLRLGQHARKQQQTGWTVGRSVRG